MGYRMIEGVLPACEIYFSTDLFSAMRPAHLICVDVRFVLSHCCLNSAGIPHMHLGFDPVLLIASSYHSHHVGDEAGN